MQRFRFGLAGLSGPLTERRIYGDKLANLESYSQMFGAFEVGASQYGHWTRENAASLVQNMPSNVKLIARMSREIFLDGKVNDGEYKRWLDSVEPMLRAQNTGPLYIPWRDEWSESSQAELDHLLDQLWSDLPSHHHVAVEFRHPSWFRPEPVQRLEEYGAGLVWSTLAGRVPYRRTADFCYIRLTGAQTRRVPDEVAALSQQIIRRPEDDRPCIVISGKHADPYGIRALESFADRVGQPINLGGVAGPLPSHEPARPTLRAFVYS